MLYKISGVRAGQHDEINKMINDVTVKFPLITIKTNLVLEFNSKHLHLYKILM